MRAAGSTSHESAHFAIRRGAPARDGADPEMRTPIGDAARDANAERAVAAEGAR